MTIFSSTQSALSAFTVAAFLSVNIAIAEPVFEPVSSYNRASVFFLIGLPVGKLLIETDRGRKTCTGFLISQKHLITNEHCVTERNRGGKRAQKSPGPVLKIELRLGYTANSDSAAQADYQVVLPPLEMNGALDYAILEVLGNPALQFGFLTISADPPTKNMPLWIIGHPSGKPQQISRTHCKSAKPAFYRKHRLHHHCGSIPGSSGSPVFDATSRQVIALNNAYFGKGKSGGLAVPFSAIVPESPILQMLTSTQHSQ